jgi:hypothetical protein
MRIDLYTKTILTVIAAALLTIACSSIIQPTSVAAQGSLAGVQFVASGPGFFAFDTRSGEIWQYPYPNQDYAPARLGKITQLGQPYIGQ